MRTILLLLALAPFAFAGPEPTKELDAARKELTEAELSVAKLRLFLPKAEEAPAEWELFITKTAHDAGLSNAVEVKRIRAQMDSLIASTGFKGSFADFARFLRTEQIAGVFSETPR